LDSLRNQGITVNKITDTQTEKRYRFVLGNGHQYRLAMTMGQPMDEDTIVFPTDGDQALAQPADLRRLPK